MKRLLFVFIYFVSLFLCAQQKIDIWGGVTPLVTTNIYDNTEMYMYTPSDISTKHPAVLILPGGNYGSVNMENEGHQIANWMSQNGFTSFVLKYRLPNGVKDVPFEDVEQALTIINKNAESWNIDGTKIGLIGSSTGGHLAATVSNMKPKSDQNIPITFTVLFYPIISFDYKTIGSIRCNLLGQNPSAADIFQYSADKQVTSETPPTIIFTADGDGSVSPIHSSLYYEALRQHNVSASLYIFPIKDNNWLMDKSFLYNSEMRLLLKAWLKKEVLSK